MTTSKDLKLNEKVASIILAGGQGTRLHPLTLHRCKPAVSFGGKYRLIDIPISNSLNSQIYRIIVISQYFAAFLQQHLSITYPHTQFGGSHLEMLCPEETSEGVKWFKGTADAIRQNINYLKDLPIEYFLILSGDQLYNIDLLEMVSFAKNHRASLVIASLPVKEKEAKRMGLMKIDKEHKIIDFFEKPTTEELLSRFEMKKDLYLGSMGIYVFEKEALLELLTKEGDDFGKDLIPLMIQKKNSFSYVYEGYWEDIGTVSSYYEANLALLSQENCLNTYDRWHPIYTADQHLPSPLIIDTVVSHSIISQGCIIKAKKIEKSLIGVRTEIGEGSSISDSIVIGNPGSHEEKMLHIGKNCTISKAILDENCRIGSNVCLINQNNLLHYDGDGIFIRDGIMIVTSGTHVPDGFIL